MSPPPDDRLEVVARIELFDGLSREALQRILSVANEVRHPAGAVLLRSGAAADALYVLLDGHLLVLDEDESGEERALNELGPGAVLGEIALLAGGERSTTVRVVEDATLLRIAREELEQLLHEHPSIQVRSTELASRRLHRSQLAAYLGRFVDHIDTSMLRTVERAVEWVHLDSGDVLFRDGDPADAAFGVISGRLRVVAGAHRGAAPAMEGERILNEVGRGESVGEMALLTDDRRSATAYAIRDTDLVKFPRQVFEGLVREHPQVMTQITRLVVARLKAHSDPSAQSVRGRTHTLALIPARPDVPLDAFAARLVEALAERHATLHLTAQRVEAAFGKQGVAQIPRREPAGIRLVQWLTEQEASHRFVVYQAEQEWSVWTERCARQADQVLVVALASSPPEPEPIERRLDDLWHGAHAPRRCLVLLHPDGDTSPLGTARWLDRRRVDRHYHVRLRSDGDIARLARLLSGRALGLVLGGGGARGFAHIGVLRAFGELGIPVDVVGGASMGSLIAAGCALGWSPDAIQQGCREHCISVFDPTLPLVALLVGRKIRTGLVAAFGDRQIEDLWIPYFAVSTNLTRADSVVHERGSLAAAVRSSLSLPGIMPPVFRDGDLLVDGGLLNNVPIDVMGSVSEGGRVVAVDVSPQVDLVSSEGFSTELSGWRLLLNRLNPFSPPLEVPGIHSVLVRSTLLASVSARNRMLETTAPSLYLQPEVGRFSLLDFKSLEAIVEAGYDSCAESIRSWWAEESS